MHVHVFDASTRDGSITPAAPVVQARIRYSNPSPDRKVLTRNNKPVSVSQSLILRLGWKKFLLELHIVHRVPKNEAPNFGSNFVKS